MATPTKTLNFSNAQKKEWAKLLYIQNELSQKEIAQKVETSEQTLCKWIKNEGWEHQRTSLVITKENQLALIYDQLSALNNAIKASPQQFATPAQADTLIKYSAAIRSLETETALADVIEVAKRFIKFIRPIDLEKAKEVTRLFDAFIKDASKRA